MPRPRITERCTAGAKAETAWRRWSTQHRVAAAMLGGLMGGHIASLLGIWFGGFSLHPLAVNPLKWVGFLAMDTAPPELLFVRGRRRLAWRALVLSFVATVLPFFYPSLSAR